MLFDRTTDLSHFNSCTDGVPPVFITGKRNNSQNVEASLGANYVIEFVHSEEYTSSSSTSADIVDKIGIYVNGECIAKEITLEEFEQKLWNILPNNNIFIDISSMGVRLLAIVLSNLVFVLERKAADIKVYCGYAEPTEYSRRGITSDNSTWKQSQFALYSDFAPLGPLPNFDSIGSDEKKQLWVVLLGFEGYRTDTIDDELSRIDDIIALVTIPSLRLGWSNYAISENSHFLRGVDHRIPSINYVTASSPFAVYNFLCETQEKYRDFRLQISPFSTKANSLGALLYALVNPESLIVFDNPLESSRPKTTRGEVYHVYEITEALEKAFINGCYPT